MKNVTVQIAKPLNTAKSAAKPTTKPTQAPAQVVEAVTPKLAYRMLQGFRPQAGAALYAHTQAALTLLGMDKGEAIPRARLALILGDTAIKHHSNSTGFFEQTSAGVAVSSLGKDAFAMRHIDPELLEAFTDILSTGKTTKTLPTSYTNPIGIKAL